jgi:hypothetical protein
MMDKRIAELIREARNWAGWRVEDVKAGWALYPPDRSKSPVLVHRTPSDHRAWQNTISELRKRGGPV